MQFLLTEEEYQDLINLNEKLKEDMRETLQDLCSKVADNMPVIFWGNKEPKIWGCWKTGMPHMTYCDACPVKKVCPAEFKRWSK